MSKAKLLFLAVSLCVITASCSRDRPDTSEKTRAAPVVVYAAGEIELMHSLLDAYTAETGVSILLTTESGRALIDRLAGEKHRSMADLLLADAIGHLWRAAELDILRPTSSELLEASIPESLQDPENLWFALRLFGRTVAYDRRVVDPGELTSYAAMGDERWRGKLCLSSAADVDNQTLIAMLIAEHGERSAEIIVRSWITNLAMPAVTDDTQVLQEIADGRCGLGIVNSDDVLHFRRENPDSPLALFWPPASSGGSYINAVGAGVTRHAGNPAGARALLEWLSSEKGRKLLAGRNLKYPGNEDAAADDVLGDWEDLQISPISLAGAAYHHEDAVLLMERAGWRN